MASVDASYTNSGTWKIRINYTWTADTRAIKITSLQGQRSNYASAGTSDVTLYVYNGSTNAQIWTSSSTSKQINFAKGTSSWSSSGWALNGLNTNITIPAGCTSIYFKVYTGTNNFNDRIKNHTWDYSGSKVSTPDTTRTVSMSHWAFGFQHGEGNNGGANNAFKLTDTSFTPTNHTNYEMNTGRATTIPNGYYLSNSIGSNSYASSWTYYTMPYTFYADRNAGFEYDYHPYSYTITYNVGSGTNNPNNPSSYNILYGVTFADPTPPANYAFDHWEIGGTTVTGINPGANATFSSATDLYNKLSTRTTGNQTVTAVYRSLGYTLTLNKGTGIASVTGAGTYTSGTQVNISCTLSTGYKFVNWTEGSTVISTSTSATITMGSAARTLTANGTKNTYYVYYNQGTATSGTLPSTQSGLYQASLTLGTNNMAKTNTEVNSYTVTYNQGTADSGTLPSNQTSKNITSYTKNGWTTTSGSQTRNYADGASYTIPANNLTLYPCFTQSTVNGGVTLGTNNMTKNTIVNATYTITYNYNGSGQSSTTATSTKSTSYTKNGWTTTSGSSTRNYTNGQATGALSANLTLYPCFTPSTSTTSVTLPIPKRFGYTFGGWYGEAACTTKIGDGGASYTPTASKTLYAKWTALIHVKDGYGRLHDIATVYYKDNSGTVHTCTAIYKKDSSGNTVEIK